jgi:hypothetical protein
MRPFGGNVKIFEKSSYGGFAVVSECLMSVLPAACGLHLVVAFDQVGGIGKNGTIPWTLPPDLKRFKELTTSLPQGAGSGSFNVVIMVTNPLPSNKCCIFLPFPTIPSFYAAGISHHPGN